MKTSCVRNWWRIHQQLSDGSEMGKLMKISEQVYAFEHYISQVSSCGSSMYVWYIPLRTWIGRRGTCETRAHFEIPKLEYKTEFPSMALITQHTQTYVIKTSSWLRNLQHLVGHGLYTGWGGQPFLYSGWGVQFVKLEMLNHYIISNLLVAKL